MFKVLRLRNTQSQLKCHFFHEALPGYFVLAEGSPLSVCSLSSLLLVSVDTWLYLRYWNICLPHQPICSRTEGGGEFLFTTDPSAQGS